jgi:hypothetical protein
MTMPPRPSPAKIAGLLAGGAWWLIAGRHKPSTPSPHVEAYALLGLGPTATAEDIQAAWRRRVAAAHPDRGGSEEAVARLTAARDLLLQRLTA